MLEIEINQYKIQEKEFDVVIENLKAVLEKLKKHEAESSKNINKLRSKLEFAASLEK